MKDFPEILKIQNWLLLLTSNALAKSLMQLENNICYILDNTYLMHNWIKLKYYGKKLSSGCADSIYIIVFSPSLLHFFIKNNLTLTFSWGYLQLCNINMTVLFIYMTQCRGGIDYYTAINDTQRKSESIAGQRSNYE